MPAPDGAVSEAVVPCADGEHVVYGGCEADPRNLAVITSRPDPAGDADADGWMCRVRNDTGVDGTFTAIAYCL